MTGNRYLKTEPLEWEATESPGFLVKRLHEDADRGETTWLMKMEPGCSSPPHAHEEFEEVFILEGSFHDGERLLKAGDYVARDVGAMHSSDTYDGAVMLVTYRRRSD
jgi:anti-sigma factor ChrR (cupin superfamily)